MNPGMCVRCEKQVESRISVSGNLNYHDGSYCKPCNEIIWGRMPDEVLRPLKVFKMNDYEWWMAESIEEAKKQYAVYLKGVVGDDEIENDPEELTDGDLERLNYVDDYDQSISRSFKEELDRRIAKGDKGGFFATTEY